VQKRSIDLRNFRLDYKGWKSEKNQGRVLASLVHNGHQELATYFVTRCDVRDYADDLYYGSSTLIMASRRSYLEIVQALLGREGTDVDKGDHYGYTALQCAASEEGHVEIARALLQAGANARKSNNRGETPLHYACEKGNIEIVRALLEAGAGADVRKCDESGMHPIYRACVKKDLEMFRALVEAGGDVNRVDSRDGTTVLHDASGSGFTEGVRYLCVERDADVNKSADNRRGDTPLSFASVHGEVEVVRLLLESGADVNKCTCERGTPLDYALLVSPLHTEQKRRNKVEIAALLREAGAYTVFYRPN
jgi:ankyrin repeat protein